jgi:type I restriction enzyme S subunit
MCNGVPSKNTTSEDWQVAKLGDVLKELYRYPTYYGIQYVDSGVPEIRGELILPGGILDTRLERYRYISEKTAANFPRVRLAPGDFAMSVRGTLGKVAMIPPKLAGAVITANLIRLQFDVARVEPSWAKHLLISQQFQDRLDAESSATTIRTIQAPTLENIQVL